MQEVWKDVIGHEGLYQVSNLGRVKSLKGYNGVYKIYYDRERILKPNTIKSGYFQVRLCFSEKSKCYLVHRLVAEAFIPNPENKVQVNHINGIKTDNRVENLEWCTNGENQKHAIKIGLKNIKKGKEHSCSKRVIQYDKQGNFIKKWDSMMDIERELNIYHTAICFCCKGKYKTAGGYVWKYFREAN